MCYNAFNLSFSLQLKMKNYEYITLKANIPDQRDAAIKFSQRILN